MILKLPEHLRPKGVIFVEPGTKLSPELLERIRQDFASHQSTPPSESEATEGFEDEV